jgi:hypothetical protein
MLFSFSYFYIPCYLILSYVPIFLQNWLVKYIKTWFILDFKERKDQWYIEGKQLILFHAILNLFIVNKLQLVLKFVCNMLKNQFTSLCTMLYKNTINIFCKTFRNIYSSGKFAVHLRHEYIVVQVTHNLSLGIEERKFRYQANDFWHVHKTAVWV